MNDTILLVTQGTQLIGTLAPIGIDLALKIKALLNQPGSDISAEIRTMRDGAIAALDETDAMIAKRKAERGITD